MVMSAITWVDEEGVVKERSALFNFARTTTRGVIQLFDDKRSLTEVFLKSEIEDVSAIGQYSY